MRVRVFTERGWRLRKRYWVRVRVNVAKLRDRTARKCRGDVISLQTNFKGSFSVLLLYTAAVLVVGADVLATQQRARDPPSLIAPVVAKVAAPIVAEPIVSVIPVLDVDATPAKEWQLKFDDCLKSLNQTCVTKEKS